MSSLRPVKIVAGVLAGAHLLPSIAAVGGVRHDLLSGRGRPGHVALTFDDGPDPESTPAFLDALDRLAVTATFFVLGVQLAAAPGLGRDIAARGHELAVHGWDHRNHLTRWPTAIVRDIRRSRDLIADVTGRRPRFWRPPYGIPTGTGLVTARVLDLRPVLWTASARDWTSYATAASVTRYVRTELRDSGTLLLHDSDTVSRSGAYRVTLAALPPIVRAARDGGWTVGPLGEHFGSGVRRGGE